MQLAHLRTFHCVPPITRLIVTFSTPARSAMTASHPGYVGSCVLAPMVRTGELPTRLLSLKYGADAVWGPETVDKGIIGCHRVYNTAIDCVEFKKGANSGKGEDRVVFRTHSTLEKDKLIFQIGTASPELAVQGASIVAKDVAGIDVNAGCPKHFSIHSGMGAALLKTPDKLTSILEALVNEVGRPHNIPISVKIRILDDLESTLDLVRRICATGIVRLTVHCRTTPMRPREPARREMLADIARVCHESGVQCYANGDVESRSHAERLISEYGVDGCMIARAAEANPSVFREEGALPWREVAEEYLKTAMSIGHHVANVKFCLSHIVPGGSELYNLVTKSKSVEQLCAALSLMPVDVEKKSPSNGTLNAIQRAMVSESAQAAGGHGIIRQKGKKLSERGVMSIQTQNAASQPGGRCAAATV